MKSIHTNPAIWAQDIPTSAKLIMLFLASFCDSKGECDPAIEDISNYCDLSGLIVKKHINTLIDRGLLQRTLRPSQTSLFKLTLPDARLPKRAK